MTQTLYDVGNHFVVLYEHIIAIRGYKLQDWEDFEGSQDKRYVIDVYLDTGKTVTLGYESNEAMEQAINMILGGLQ